MTLDRTLAHGNRHEIVIKITSRKSFFVDKRNAAKMMNEKTYAASRNVFRDHRGRG